MTITVGDIYSAFPTFSPEAMIKLCNGNKELNGRTVVPLANIAAFGNQELSIFAAEREGKNFTNLVSKQERPKLNRAAGIKDTENPQTGNKNENNLNSIPMDKSIFDIASSDNAAKTHDIM